MDILRTLLVQARLRWQDPAENRRHLAELLSEAGADFDLAVFPETFTTGFLGDRDGPEEDMAGETVRWMARLARNYQAALTGSIVIAEDGHRYNRMVFVTPDGQCVHYDKRHLFAFGGENRRYTAGRDRVVLAFRGWRINLQVCYDLRFPAWCRNRSDYDLMLLVANWPTRRIAHWSSLLEARAIENQSWVVGVNRVGEDGNGVRYPGASVVHDPLGECLARLGDEETCRLVELDLERVRQIREKLPFLADADRFEISG